MLKWRNILCARNKEINMYGREVRECLTEVLRQRRVERAL